MPVLENGFTVNDIEMFCPNHRIVLQPIIQNCYAIYMVRMVLLSIKS